MDAAERKKRENDNFNRILGGIRNLVRDEIREITTIIAEREVKAAIRGAKLKRDTLKAKQAVVSAEIAIQKAEAQANQKQPALLQVWRPKDKRRQHAVFRIDNTQLEGMDEIKTYVTISLKDGRKHEVAAADFVKRYEFVADTELEYEEKVLKKPQAKGTNGKAASHPQLALQQ